MTPSQMNELAEKETDKFSPLPKRGRGVTDERWDFICGQVGTERMSFKIGFLAGLQHHTRQIEYGEWQLCPKCNGGGRAMNMDHPIPTTFDVCDVCNGQKKIVKPARQVKEDWISVNEKLPDVGDEYNVVYDLEDGEEPLATTMEWDAINKKWLDVIGAGDECKTVSHWQPIPNPPDNQTLTEK